MVYNTQGPFPGGCSRDDSNVHGAKRGASAARMAVRRERNQPSNAHVHLALELHYLLCCGLEVIELVRSPPPHFLTG